MKLKAIKKQILLATVLQIICTASVFAGDVTTPVPGKTGEHYFLAWTSATLPRDLVKELGLLVSGERRKIALKELNNMIKKQLIEKCRRHSAFIYGDIIIEIPRGLGTSGFAMCRIPK